MNMDRNIRDLKMAVLEQAVADWKAICARGVRRKTYEGMCHVKAQIRELRRFFKSALCSYYADGVVNPDVILQKMEEIYLQSKAKRDIEAIERGDALDEGTGTEKIPE